MVRRFLRSELGIVWLQYLAAGLAMIPVGLLYFEFSTKLSFWLSAAIAVMVGLSVSTCVGYFLRLRAAKPFLVAEARQVSDGCKDIFPQRAAFWAGASANNLYPLSDVIQAPIRARAASQSSLG
jgi:hypothetical protein